MSLMSRLKEIEALRMTRIGSRPVKCEAIVKIGNMIVVRLPKGRWWSSWDNFNRYAFPLGQWHGRVPDLLQALVLLGLLDKKICDEQLRRAKDADLHAERESEIEMAADYAAKHGFKLVPADAPKGDG